ncbi:hypothetical protein A3Q56_00744 [Intoshia linei]|uniref:Myb/SANT-like DNA-binding domain-containing protein n=1 Tax=Intoshia linei TaxID=1819745 RepID=A0A177BAY6_9BILA|nr:hypothetical protein A3Q56_00744 [Intoshia linei]
MPPKSQFRFSAHDDILLLREVLNQNPYPSPGSNKTSAQETRNLRNVWNTIAKSLEEKGMCVSRRLCREHTALLMQQYTKIDTRNLRRNGTLEDYLEKELLIAQVIELKNGKVNQLKPNGYISIQNQINALNNNGDNGALEPRDIKYKFNQARSASATGIQDFHKDFSKTGTLSLPDSSFNVACADSNLKSNSNDLMVQMNKNINNLLINDMVEGDLKLNDANSSDSAYSSNGDKHGLNSKGDVKPVGIDLTTMCRNKRKSLPTSTNYLNKNKFPKIFSENFNKSDDPNKTVLMSGILNKNNRIMDNLRQYKPASFNENTLGLSNKKGPFSSLYDMYYPKDLTPNCNKNSNNFHTHEGKDDIPDNSNSFNYEAAVSSDVRLQLDMERIHIKKSALKLEQMKFEETKQYHRQTLECVENIHKCLEILINKI